MGCLSGLGSCRTRLKVHVSRRIAGSKSKKIWRAAKKKNNQEQCEQGSHLPETPPEGPVSQILETSSFVTLISLKKKKKRYKGDDYSVSLRSLANFPHSRKFCQYSIVFDHLDTLDLDSGSANTVGYCVLPLPC